MSQANKKTAFRLRLAAPFGRYIGRSESEPEIHQTLIGREGQRAHFRDLLLNHGPHGAFLVTGQRGAGKTSFVRESLRQYEADVYSRALRCDVGRLIYWDRFMIPLLALLAIVLAMMAHEVLNILIFREEQQYLPGHERIRSLFWLAVLPFAAVCAAPIIYAMKLISVEFDSRRRRNQPEDQPDLTQFKSFWTVVGFTVIALLGSSPTEVVSALAGDDLALIAQVKAHVTVSRLFVAIACAALLMQHFSVRKVTIFREPNSGPAFAAETLLLRWKYAVTYAVAMAAPLTLDILARESDLWVWALELGLPWPSHVLYWGNLGLGSTIISAVLLLNSRFGEMTETKNLGKRLIANWYTLGATICAVAGTIFILYGFKQTPQDFRTDIQPWVHIISMLPIASASIHARILYRLNRTLRATNEVLTFVPRPRFALQAKAMVFVLGGVHLLQPLLAVFFSALFGEGRVSFLVSLDSTAWPLAMLLILVTIAHLEYMWIMVPYAWVRDDRSRDLSRELNKNLDNPQLQSASNETEAFLREQLSQRRYVRHTFYWLVYTTWLQLIVVQVNLGFDKLEHQHIVHAMLTGLREQYRNRFLRWSAPAVLGGNIMKIMVALILATIISERLFGCPPPAVDTSAIAGKSETEIWSFLSSQRATHAAQLRDLEMGKVADASPTLTWLLREKPNLVALLYYPLLGGGGEVDSRSRSAGEAHGNINQADRKDLMWCEFIPCVRAPELPAHPGGNFAIKKDRYDDLHRRWDATSAPHEGVTVRVYNMLVFFIVIVALYFIARKLGITPYRRVHQAIEGLLDKLTGRTGTVRAAPRLSLRGGLADLATANETYSREFERADPRVVEMELMTILAMASAPRLPFVALSRLHLPAPEITFVFDELDKVGAHIGEPGDTSRDDEDWSRQGPERLRSRAIHKLFAEMKNLLSAAPARFVMVGGRNLHDEWLADQTARVPLLTNIFRGSIYLPSLLTDEVDPKMARWSQRVWQYVDLQRDRAKQNFRSWRVDRSRPYFGLAPRNLYQPGFAQPVITAGDRKPIQFESWSDSGVVDQKLIERWSESLTSEFVEFLTFRSMGNPKKLKELFESFVRPTGRYLKRPEERWGPNFMDCDHILLLGEDELFRIQLVASVYRQLRNAFETRYAQRDDKLVSALFYFSDFLFKFHRRAFNWMNLERVDELVHIHRAPDHRILLEGLVLQWSERILHPILNGLYVFRFRSDMAREIEYISRRSKEEMAAFNFTLDESQALKEIYNLSIKNMRDRDSHDVISGLGELHEFDQEFDAARHYYGRALMILDRAVGEEFEDESLGKVGVLTFVLGGSTQGRELARRHMTWGVNRLRIMLQIGLSFEITRNLERAAIEYRDARQLSRVLLLAFVGDEESLQPKPEQNERIHSVKHLNILFQAIYAEAWVSEKMTGAVDTSTSLIETEINSLRGMLPFVSKSTSDHTKDLSPNSVRHANLSLIMAELHNKAGDLYFFKGRQHMPAKDLAAQLDFEAGSENQRKHRRGAEGFLLRAHHHYAMGLHDIRRFISYRWLSSERKLNIWSEIQLTVWRDGSGIWKTMEQDGWSDFMFRIAGSGLADLAEASLARVSLFGLFGCVARGAERCTTCTQNNILARDHIDSFRRAMKAWLACSDDTIDFSTNISINGVGQLGEINSWLGLFKVSEDGTPDFTQLTYSEMHSDSQRLVTALLMSFAGAEMLEQAGYMEDAARELLQVVDAVTHYLWWATGVRHVYSNPEIGFDSSEAVTWSEIAKGRNLNLDKGCQFWCLLLDLAIEALVEANRFLTHSQRVHQPERKQPSRLGHDIPVEMLYLTCSLGLVADSVRWRSEGRRTKVLDLLGDMGGLDLVSDQQATVVSQLKVTFDASAWTDLMRNIVKGGLARFAFPVLARLRGLKLLIEDSVLSPQGDRSLVPTMARELQLLDAQVQAPLHFTPIHLGPTLAHAYLREEMSEDFEPSELRELGLTAKRLLEASLEVTSMRRAFYESISDLYYLYDDFNDRQIHFNHALQMAGWEYVELLLECIEKKLRA